MEPDFAITNEDIELSIPCGVTWRKKAITNLTRLEKFVSLWCSKQIVAEFVKLPACMHKIGPQSLVKSQQYVLFRHLETRAQKTFHKMINVKIMMRMSRQNERSMIINSDTYLLRKASCLSAPKHATSPVDAISTPSLGSAPRSLVKENIGALQPT